MPSSYTLPESWFTDHKLLDAWLRTKLINPNARFPLFNEVQFYDNFPWALYDEYQREWTSAPPEFAYFLSRPYGCSPSNSDNRGVGVGGHWQPLDWTVVSFSGTGGWVYLRGTKRILRYHEQEEENGEIELQELEAMEEEEVLWVAHEFMLLYINEDRMIGDWALYKLERVTEATFQTFYGD